MIGGNAGQSSSLAADDFNFPTDLISIQDRKDEALNGQWHFLHFLCENMFTFLVFIWKYIQLQVMICVTGEDLIYFANQPNNDLKLII